MNTLGLADHHPGELVDRLGAEPADQLADRGLIRRLLGQRQQAERRRCSESDTSRTRVS
jgi:hypothetical protein